MTEGDMQNDRVVAHATFHFWTKNSFPNIYFAFWLAQKLPPARPKQRLTKIDPQIRKSFL